MRIFLSGLILRTNHLILYHLTELYLMTVEGLHFWYMMILKNFITEETLRTSDAPHFPVQPPQQWLDKVKKREKGIDNTRAGLVAFIEHMDDGIGKVINALKESGQFDNTIIIFSSDNGGHLPSKANNGPLRDGKQSMY